MIQNPRLSRNNFDLVRLCLAAFVCFAHSYILSGREELHWVARTFSSTLAVQAFFVVSGFLIVMSYERSSSLRSYASKRIRRIYPAYATVILLCAFGLYFVSTLDASEYFSRAWVKYVVANLTFMTFLQPSLPGVFDEHLVTAVNGALWTLKIEAMFYISVPFIVMLVRRFGALRTLIPIYVGSVLFAMVASYLAVRTGRGVYLELGRQLPGQLSYFVAGALLYYYLPVLERRTVWFVLPAVLVMAFDHFFPLPWLEPAALATIVVFAALFGYVGNFGKYGDFSYGLYILHFPIIQLAIELRVFANETWAYFAAVVAAALIAAMLMWHLVEKHFLDRRSHYRVVSEHAGASQNYADGIPK